MSQAVDGGMAAILNASEDEIRSILLNNQLTNLDLANFNTPSQIVISGRSHDIVAAKPIFQKQNISFIRLNTSGAFHSRFMQPMKEKFEAYLKEFTFLPPTIPVIANTTAEPYDASSIVLTISEQLTSPVRWCDTIDYLMQQGQGKMVFEELGVGDVLTKMVNKIRIEREEEKTDNNQKTTIPFDASIPESLKIKTWNQRFPVGTRVKTNILSQDIHETRTQAKVLFGHRAVVYLKGYNGYFDLNEIVPI